MRVWRRSIAESSAVGVLIVLEGVLLGVVLVVGEGVTVALEGEGEAMGVMVVVVVGVVMLIAVVAVFVLLSVIACGFLSDIAVRVMATRHEGCICL